MTTGFGFCATCGTPRAAADQKFCAVCGSAVSSAAPPVAPLPPVAPPPVAPPPVWPAQPYTGSPTYAAPGTAATKGTGANMLRRLVLGVSIVLVAALVAVSWLGVMQVPS